MLWPLDLHHDQKSDLHRKSQSIRCTTAGAIVLPSCHICKSMSAENPVGSILPVCSLRRQGESCSPPLTVFLPCALPHSPIRSCTVWHRSTDFWRTSKWRQRPPSPSVTSVRCDAFRSSSAASSSSLRGRLSLRVVSLTYGIYSCQTRTCNHRNRRPADGAPAVPQAREEAP